MDTIQFDSKLLKKLVKECRKLGISAFKGYGMEFVVGPEPQPKVANNAPKQTGEQPVKKFVQETIETDELTEQDLLFWSTVGGPTQGEDPFTTGEN